MRSVVVLPQPDGPEQRQELAGRDGEAHVARGVDLALHAMREALGDAVDVDGDGCRS